VRRGLYQDVHAPYSPGEEFLVATAVCHAATVLSLSLVLLTQATAGDHSKSTEGWPGRVWPYGFRLDGSSAPSPIWPAIITNLPARCSTSGPYRSELFGVHPRRYRTGGWGTDAGGGDESGAQGRLAAIRLGRACWETAARFLKARAHPTSPYPLAPTGPRAPMTAPYLPDGTERAMDGCWRLTVASSGPTTPDRCSSCKAA